MPRMPRFGQSRQWPYRPRDRTTTEALFAATKTTRVSRRKCIFLRRKKQNLNDANLDPLRKCTPAKTWCVILTTIMSRGCLRGKVPDLPATLYCLAWPPALLEAPVRCFSSRWDFLRAFAAQGRHACVLCHALGLKHLRSLCTLQPTHFLLIKSGLPITWSRGGNQTGALPI